MLSGEQNKRKVRQRERIEAFIEFSKQVKARILCTSQVSETGGETSVRFV